MAKILSKAGVTLADVYDVQGSVAGIDELLSKEVNLVHELGSTILSERLVGTIFAIDATAIAASVTWNVTFFTGNDHARLLGVQVITDQASRIANASLHISENPPSVTELPIWAWEAADTEISIQSSIAGTVTARLLLAPNPGTIHNLPNLMVGGTSITPASQISFRGVASAFGAGTVRPQALIYLAHSAGGGTPGNKGLPLPGW